jgi:hypothetical protein
MSEAEVRKQIAIIKTLVETEMAIDNGLKEDDITIEIHIKDKTVSVEVCKEFYASTHGILEELDSVIQRIRAYQSPLEPFLFFSQQKGGSSKTPFGPSLAQGLARLALETGALLDFYVTENHVLSLSATRYLH